MELEDKDLSFNYRTHCDPRLNYEQSLGEFDSWFHIDRAKAWNTTDACRRRFPHL
jgi:3-deoxy-D-arabino-heptulosonate 7-phosphate (DAHP) synthase class II